MCFLAYLYCAMVKYMIELLQEKNPNLPLYGVDSEEFASFGRVIRGLDTAELLRAAKTIENPVEGSSYLPAVEAFEALPVATEIRSRLFGTLPTQMGYCWGYSRQLNGAEWHTSSEVNVAVTDLVLLLGHLWDVQEGRIDSSAFTAFYVPAGTAIEVYATTLHFCPCQVTDTGFGCVVALPVGTNTPLEAPTEDPLLFRRNKWIVAHNENPGLIARGVVPGISGTNVEIKY